MVPIERIRLVVDCNVADVRKKLAANTSEYVTGLAVLKLRAAKNPKLLFVGEIGEKEIRLCRNPVRGNSGRPHLKAKLAVDGNRTIISGWLGLHSGVAIIGGGMLVPALESPSKVLPLVLGTLIVLVGGGYWVGRRQLLGALTRCLDIETP